MALELNEVHHGDCLELMRDIPGGSVDMILCDLPYGTTTCKWDTVIPFEPLWAEYKRVIKDNGAVVLFGQEPFSSTLRVSNIREYKYDWYWRKSKAQGFFNVKKMPLKDVETISVFYKSLPIYNPQGVVEINKVTKNSNGKIVKGLHLSSQSGGAVKQSEYIQKNTNYPKQSLDFKNATEGFHPTQKPVQLFEYLVKTYTNEGETVLDNCMGSGTTAVACMNTNRNYIGFELEKEYYDLSMKRIDEHTT